MFVIIALFPNSPINFFLCEHVTPVSLTFDDCHDDVRIASLFWKNHPVCPLSQRGIYNSMCIDCLTECVVSSYIWFLPFSSEWAVRQPRGGLLHNSLLLHTFSILSVCVAGKIGVLMWWLTISLYWYFPHGSWWYILALGLMLHALLKWFDIFLFSVDNIILGFI